MATNLYARDDKTKSSVYIFIIVGLCGFFYLLGTWQRNGFDNGETLSMEMTETGSKCNFSPNLNFETHHNSETVDQSTFKVKDFPPCDANFTDYTPCQDQKRAMKFPRNDMIYRERHCPSKEEKLKCLVPAPEGYVTPFLWPKSRDYVPYANAPYKALTVEKAKQNWIQYEGNVFRFPGGGTQFPEGADAYINQLASVIPIDNGNVRTALDTGCGVCFYHNFCFRNNSRIFLYVKLFGVHKFVIFLTKDCFFRLLGIFLFCPDDLNNFLYVGLFGNVKFVIFLTKV